MPREDWIRAEKEFHARARQRATDVNIVLRVSIRTALSKLPWSLLSGAEKRGPRDRQTSEARVTYAAKVIAEQIELNPKLRERYRR